MLTDVDVEHSEFIVEELHHKIDEQEMEALKPKAEDNTRNVLSTIQ